MKNFSAQVLLLLLILTNCKTPDTNVDKTGLTDTLPGKDTIPALGNGTNQTLDTALYDQKLREIFHNKRPGAWMPDTSYPLAGAILPFKRIVAYYGNFYSKGMGILGKYPPDTMLAKLQYEVKKWEKAEATLREMEKLLPEKSRVGIDRARFNIFLGKADYAGAAIMALKVSDANKEDAMLQNELAWGLITQEGNKTPDLDVAQKIASPGAG